MSIKDNLFSLRTKHNYSQEELASILGITKQEYANIENGINSITNSQIEILSDLYIVSIGELFYGETNIKKYEQMYFYILSKYENGITKTKLSKLLYLADFRHFYENLKSMSGAMYKCKEKGPLADSFLELTDELFEKEKIRIEFSTKETSTAIIKASSINDNYNLLNEKEKKELDELCKLWKDVSTKEIVNYCCCQKPWMTCRKDEVISYSLILQEDPAYIYTPAS